jgi:hypothetical protein
MISPISTSSITKPISSPIIGNRNRIKLKKSYIVSIQFSLINVTTYLIYIFLVNINSIKAILSYKVFKIIDNFIS